MGTVNVKSAAEVEADTKESLKAHVNTVRAEKERGPFTVQGYSIDTDPSSASKITGKIVAIKAELVSGDVSWRMADNVTYQIAQADFVTLAGELSDKVEAVYGFSWQLKADIDAGMITDIKQIDDANWPE